MSVWISVALASPVTCQSITVPWWPPLFLTCQRQGMTGDKARVTDIDRMAIPSVHHGQGAASPCVTLSDRVEPCAWGGMMQLPDRRPAQQRWLYLCFTYMHTNHCRLLNETTSYTQTRVSANRPPTCFCCTLWSLHKTDFFLSGWQLQSNFKDKILLTYFYWLC